MFSRTAHPTSPEELERHVSFIDPREASRIKPDFSTYYVGRLYASPRNPADLDPRDLIFGLTRAVVGQEVRLPKGTSGDMRVITRGYGSEVDGLIARVNVSLTDKESYEVEVHTTSSDYREIALHGLFAILQDGVSGAARANASESGISA